MFPSIQCNYIYTYTWKKQQLVALWKRAAACWLASVQKPLQKTSEIIIMSFCAWKLQCSSVQNQHSRIASSNILCFLHWVGDVDCKLIMIHKLGPKYGSHNERTKGERTPFVSSFELSLKELPAVLLNRIESKMKLSWAIIICLPSQVFSPLCKWYQFLLLLLKFIDYFS